MSGQVIASGVDREAAVTRCEEIDKDIRFLTDRPTDELTGSHR
ncbi:hypothetical protein ACIA8E_31645 [Streptomyces sp. NPDC051664]